jgi:hypothetical protein
MPDPTDRVATTLAEIRERYRASFTTLPGYSATLPRTEWTHVNSADDIPVLLAAVEAVLKHHQPTRLGLDIVCKTCMRLEGRSRRDIWPCEEYRDVTTALSGKEAGDELAEPAP